MSEKIDTKRMRSVVQDENYKYMTDVWQYGASHNGQCEYRHYPCAVLKLCDEIDALRAELAAARAEAERPRGALIELIEDARKLIAARSLTELTQSDLSAIDTALAAGQVAAKDLAAARLREDALRAELAKRKPIPVSERMPEEGLGVMLFDSLPEYWTIGYLYRLSEDRYQWATINRLYLHDDNFARVTHWMPLPEPPEVNDGQA